MKKAAEACYIGHVAQKARKAAKAKAREKAKKQRLAKEEDKRKWKEYLQQLQDEVLAKNTTLLESSEGSQVIETKYKETTTIFFEDEVGQWPFKKTKRKQPGKYYGNAMVKMGVLTPVRGV